MSTRLEKQIRSRAYARYLDKFNANNPRKRLEYLATDLQLTFTLSCGRCSVETSFFSETRSSGAVFALSVGWYADKLHTICPECQRDTKAFAKFLKNN